MDTRARGRTAHRRAFELCGAIGETPQLFPVLAGLWGFRFLRAELHTARELAEQLFRVARSAPDPALLVWAHTLLGLTLSMLGDAPAALRHLDEGIASYDPPARADRTQVGAQDPKVTCLSFAAWTAGASVTRIRPAGESPRCSHSPRRLSHPFSSAFALDFAAAGVGMFLRDAPAVGAHAETLLKLCRDQGFPYWSGWADVRLGWVLAERRETQAGITQIESGMATIHATGARLILRKSSPAAEAHGTGEEHRAHELLPSARAHRDDRRTVVRAGTMHRRELLLREPAQRRERKQPRGASANGPRRERETRRSLRAEKETRGGAPHVGDDRRAAGYSAEAASAPPSTSRGRKQAKSFELATAISTGLWRGGDRRAPPNVAEAYGCSRRVRHADFEKPRLLDELG